MFVTYVLGGYAILATILDGVANAIALITPLVAGVVTACIVLIWSLAYFILPSHPLPWVFGNQRMQVRKLGIKPTGILIGIVLLLWVPSLNDFFSTKCTVQAKVNSDIVSRVFFRDAFLPERGWQTLHPTSQELFYEWQVLLSVNETAKDIAVEIYHLPDDRIAIDPATGVLSEPIPRWYSGFPEPHRSKPDYLLSTAKFSHLSPDTPATVTIRRFLAKAFLSSNSLIKIKHITALNCRVRLEETEQAQDAERLQRLAQTLAERVYQANEPGSPVLLRRDPGDLAEQEIQGTMEVRCQNEPCTSLIANRFEGHMGKAPGQSVKERGVQKLTQLKEALGESFTCSKEPYEDTHPTHEALILGECRLPQSPEELQNVRAIMEKHGVKLEIIPPPPPPPAWLGVQTKTSTEPPGLFVETVIAESPAAQAGIQPHDVIIRFNSHKVSDSQTLLRLIGATAIGTTVDVDIIHEGQRHTILVTLEKRPPSRP